VAALAAAGDFVVGGGAGVDYVQVRAAACAAGETALALTVAAGGGGWPFFAVGLVVGCCRGRCGCHVLPFRWFGGLWVFLASSILAARCNNWAGRIS